MSFLWQTEIIVNIFLQGLGSWLSPMMQIFTFLGQEGFYILALPYLYWCVDTVLALRFSILLIASGYSNALLKVSFHGARPYWLDRRVQALSSEVSFGMPSGHAQNAASLWGLLAYISKDTGRKLFCIALIFLIGLSRLYLGVHFSSDVIAGWVIGAVILFLLIKLEKPFVTRFKILSNQYQMILISLISLVMLLGGLGWINIQSQVPVPAAWVQNVSSLSSVQPINPYQSDDLVSFVGIFWGMGLGFIWQRSRMEFNPAQGTEKQKLICYFSGMFGIIIISYGLGAVFPHTSDLPGIIFRLLRYGLSGLWITALAPFMFKKLNLIK
jgi:membrane-associated phospholipid phosphatase